MTPIGKCRRRFRSKDGGNTRIGHGFPGLAQHGTEAAENLRRFVCLGPGSGVRPKSFFRRRPDPNWRSLRCLGVPSPGGGGGWRPSNQASLPPGLRGSPCADRPAPLRRGIVRSHRPPPGRSDSQRPCSATASTLSPPPISCHNRKPLTSPTFSS
jgi:hypothetical protein